MGEGVTGWDCERDGHLWADEDPCEACGLPWSEAHDLEVVVNRRGPWLAAVPVEGRPHPSRRLDPLANARWALSVARYARPAPPPRWPCWRRLRPTLDAWREGRRHGYPRCCVAQWCLARLLGARGCAARRGSIPTAGGQYVPCRWHVGRAPGWRPLRRAR